MTTQPIKASELKPGDFFKTNTRQRKWRYAWKIQMLTAENTQAATWKSHLKEKEHVMIVGANCRTLVLIPETEIFKQSL